MESPLIELAIRPSGPNRVWTSLKPRRPWWRHEWQLPWPKLRGSRRRLEELLPEGGLISIDSAAKPTQKSKEPQNKTSNVVEVSMASSADFAGGGTSRHPAPVAVRRTYLANPRGQSLHAVWRC